MSYIFDKILGFDVCYRPFEKVNYKITFKYKQKLSFISINNRYATSFKKGNK